MQKEQEVLLKLNWETRYANLASLCSLGKGILKRKTREGEWETEYEWG